MKLMLSVSSPLTTIVDGHIPRFAMRLMQLTAILLLLSVDQITRAEPPKNNEKTREIFVPFADFDVLLEGQDQRVLLTRTEYEALLREARVVAEEPDSPLARVWLAAEYQATVESGRALIQGKLVLESLTDDLIAAPLQFSGVMLRAATWGDRPAPLGKDPQGMPVVFIKGRGKHELKLELIAPVITSAAEQAVTFQLPLAAATTWNWTVPGNVEVKSGAEVIRREIEEPANVTRLELLPQRESTRLVMSLNNRIQLQQRVVLARSVLIEELTAAYEKLHATVSLEIPHGAVDQLRFELPQGFDVVEVTAAQLARWAVAEGEGERKILEVMLREAVQDTVVLNLVAVSHAPRPDEWVMPQLRPLDVASHAAIVGVLAEERFRPLSLDPSGLIPINASVLGAALPASISQADAGAPQLRPVAAFYAPAADYALSAKFQRSAATLEVTANLLFTITDRGIELRGGFAIRPTAERRFTVDIPLPPEWKVEKVTLHDGAELPFDVFEQEGDGRKLQVRLPSGAPVDQFTNLFLHARHVPAGWLGDWTEQPVAIPQFSVSGATRQLGALAVQTEADFDVRVDQLAGLTPLDEKEKQEFGLQGTATRLAYRFESQTPTLRLVALRTQPRLTARTFNFLRLEPEGLFAHHELHYQVEAARARRVRLRLPPTTPEALTIRGLDVPVKEFTAADVDGMREWTVELAEPRSGAIRIAVDYQMALPNVGGGSLPEETATAEVDLPLVRATGVVYQSGVVAVEANMEFDVAIRTAARRIDIGELADADYQVGKRILGAFGFVGGAAEVEVTVTRRPEFGLPVAIVERAELVTALARHGIAQTMARFHLRTKASFLEIELPPEATLWSVVLDGRPAAPQRDANRLLISLAASTANATRDVQLVYESPVVSWERWGEVETDAPRLLLRNATGEEQAEVPLADLHWHVILPEGHQIIRSQGNVFAVDRKAVSPFREITKPVWRFLQGFTLSSVRVASTAAESANRRYYDFRAEPPRSGAVRGEAVSATADEELALPAAAAPRPADQAKSDAPSTTPEPAMPPAAEPPPPPASPLGVDDLRAATTRRARDQRPVAEGEKKYWALEGMRSLPLELTRAGTEVSYQSLGLHPRLRLTLSDARGFDFLSAALAILVGILGLVRTDSRPASKARFLLGTGLLLLATPLVIGLVVDWDIAAVFAPAFAVTCGLAVWYLFVGAVRTILGLAARVAHRPRQVAASVLVLIALTSSMAPAQENAGTLDNLRHLLNPPQPVKIPADAIVIPYDADDPEGPQRATKVYVPYEEYQRLWQRVHPEQNTDSSPLPADFASGGVTYSATLDRPDALVFSGSMEVDVFRAGTHLFPLPIQAGVLTRITLDGQPARLHIIEPREPVKANEAPAAVPQQAAVQAKERVDERIPAVVLEGVGRKRLEFQVQIKVSRSGGLRMAHGRLPTTIAAAVDLVVPDAGTQVRWGEPADGGTQAEFETRENRETLRVALAPDGNFHLQWRPKRTEGQVDDSLTAFSAVVLDVQEDALRMAWRVELAFRGSPRDTFRFTLPAGYLVEKVLGQNIRGWKRTEAGEQAVIEVTLLKAASGSESLTLLVSRRTALGEGAMANFVAPLVTVAESAQHQGLLMIRRSPLLRVGVEETEGLDRADAPDAELQPVLSLIQDDSPLGIRPFQAYRFAATPFTLRIAAAPYVASTSADVRSVVRIAERESQFEARITVTADLRPRFAVRCRLPDGLIVDQVSLPLAMQWSLSEEDGSQLLNVFLQEGQQQFSFVVRGRLERADGDQMAAPKMEVLDVDRQTAQLVVQADPAFNVQVLDLTGGETLLLRQVSHWLNAAQRSTARIALGYRPSQFSATLRIIPKQPLVRGFSITNVRVTPYAIEDTIYLEFTILDAGIRSVSFQLPASLRDARIMAPLLREKTIESVENQPDRVRVRLDLQDEVTRRFIVAVEHDRELTSGPIEAPLPTIETGNTENRFVVLENAGRDEITVTAAEDFTEINRQQSQWAKLQNTLGETIQRAFVVREGAARPQFVLQTKRRETVETVGARIGLAQTLLVVDNYGAYRGLQEYLVDNKTEPYLEVELPLGAELWTAQVAGEPVKPVHFAQAGPQSVFIPLIKSAAGDLHYSVQLKYAGQLNMPSRFGKVSFPLLHTKNIRVELSQVRLRLPETRQWLDFGGTMRHVPGEEELLAGKLAYESKQIQDLLGVLRGGDSFSKVRAAENLKQQVRFSLQNSATTFQSQPDHTELRRELTYNSELLQQANQVLEEQSQPVEQGAADNRALLLLKCASQPVVRAKNVVNQLDPNFAEDAPPATNQPAASGGRALQQFNLRWFVENQLELDKARNEALKRQSRVQFEAETELQQEGRAKQQADKTASELGKKVTEEANKEVDAKALSDAERAVRRSGETREQVDRYRQKLEQQSQSLFGMENTLPGTPTPAMDGGLQSPMPGQPGGFGMGGQAAAQTAAASVAEAGRPVAGSMPAAAERYRATGMASLDVTIPERGREFRFVTPRGEIEIEAWMIEADELSRIVPLVAMALGLAAVWWLPRAMRRGR